MATVKTITIEYTYTFNLGNYSSVKPAVTITAELAEGDNVEQVSHALRTQARVEAQTEIDLALMANGKQPYFHQLKAAAPAQEEPPF